MVTILDMSHHLGLSLRSRLWRSLEENMFDKIWSILLQEARWPFKLLFVAAIALLFISVTGCSATPAMMDDCPSYFNAEKDIDKCKKRVLFREDRAFQARQLEAMKEQCNAQDRVWVKIGYNEGCANRVELQRLFY